MSTHASEIKAILATSPNPYWYLRDGYKYLLALFAVCAMYVGIRLYQGAYAMDTGLDSTMPIFDIYWRRLFYIEITFEVIFAIAVASYLWLTRDKHMQALSIREEITRYFTFIMWGGVYGMAVYWAGSYFGEQDNAWHQAAVRDTPFTPNHIVVFYLGFPLYTILGMGLWLYARTRLPLYEKKISVPLTLAVVGPFMLLPSVGYNEWGHTFWFREELFASPVHYGFVISVWFALALEGTILQIIARMSELLEKFSLESETGISN